MFCNRSGKDDRAPRAIRGPRAARSSGDLTIFWSLSPANKWSNLLTTRHVVALQFRRAVQIPDRPRLEYLAEDSYCFHNFHIARQLVG